MGTAMATVSPTSVVGQLTPDTALRTGTAKAMLAFTPVAADIAEAEHLFERSG